MYIGWMHGYFHEMDVFSALKLSLGYWESSSLSFDFLFQLIMIIIIIKGLIIGIIIIITIIMMMMITQKRGRVINFPADEMFLEFTSDPVCSHDYSFPKTISCLFPSSFIWWATCGLSRIKKRIFQSKIVLLTDFSVSSVHNGEKYILFTPLAAKTSFHHVLQQFGSFADQYQYLGRRHYVTEPFKFTTKRLI